jgi:glycosyltransferase involved in cell wall biosynthesis
LEKQKAVEADPTKPIVSVVITTYNRVHLISRAITSVLAQTFQDLELIVVDDGSTDNTREVVQGFTDSRIQYIRFETNRGPAAGRNAGFRAARGRFIAILDSDDWWLPEKLQTQLDGLEALPALPEEVGLVSTSAWYVAGNSMAYGGDMGIDINEPPICQRAYDSRIWGALPSSWLIPRAVIDELGYLDESLSHYEDTDYLIRLTSKYRVFQILKPLVNYSHYGADALSSNFDRALRARLLVIQKHKSKFLANPEAYSSDIQNNLIGAVFSRKRNPWRRLQILWAALSVGGFNLHIWLVVLRNLPLALLPVLDFPGWRAAVIQLVPPRFRPALERFRANGQTVQIRPHINRKYDEPRLQDLVAKERQLLLSWLERDSLLLDAGCGDGRVAFRLVDNLAIQPSLIVMLDINPQMLEEVRKNIQVEESTAPLFAPVLGSVFEIPYSEDTFDAVICLGDVLSLASAGSIEEGLQELRRVTKTGGVLLLSLVTKDYLLRVAQERNLPGKIDEIEANSKAGMKVH